ncbi:hypothetical protein [Spirulina major]|uniref:hypothetical protein n=1 Tax=Spirulina major TaxID=270636 RepID=UPI0009349A0B|nr:hypothetical protein [Spirulina major]
MIKAVLGGIGLGLLALGWLGTPPALATSDCQRIREIRAIAILIGRDSHELARLEAEACGRGRVYRRERRDRLSDECVELSTIAQLAQAAEGRSPLANAVNGERQVACFFPTQTRRSFWRYANGQLVQQGSIWYYPNGQQAKFGQQWYYPDGQAATFGSTWNYPNGARAVWSNQWYSPNQTRTDLRSLLSAACSRVSTDTCETALEAIATHPEPLAQVTALSLIWQTVR